MISISELKGNKLKNDLNLKRCLYRYHNKNKSGGNFGINLMQNEYNNCVTDKTKKDYEINGDYDITGNIYFLYFSELYGTGLTKIIDKRLELDSDYNKMLEIIKSEIKCLMI